MSKNSEYFCAKCSFQAANSTSFIDDKSPFKESLECPKCGNSEIVSERIKKFRKGWRLIIESGLRNEVQSIEGVYLQLAEKFDHNIELENMKMQDVPPEVAKRLQTKMQELQEAVLDSGVLEQLKENGIRLEMHVTD